MKYKETKYGDAYKSTYNRNNHNNCYLTNASCWFGNYKQNHIDYQKSSWKYHKSQKHYEISVVSLSYTSTNDSTMMIKNLYTVSTTWTMTSFFWSNYKASFTNFHHFVTRLLYQKFSIFLRLALEKGSTRNNAWVCTSSQI